MADVMLWPAEVNQHVREIERRDRLDRAVRQATAARGRRVWADLGSMPPSVLDRILAVWRHSAPTT
jgi:hypothetical protein